VSVLVSAVRRVFCACSCELSGASGGGGLQSKSSRRRRSLRFTDSPRPSRGLVGLVAGKSSGRDGQSLAAEYRGIYADLAAEFGVGLRAVALGAFAGKEGSGFQGRLDGGLLGCYADTAKQRLHPSIYDSGISTGMSLLP
jgi:hypothetical protein